MGLLRRIKEVYINKKSKGLTERENMKRFLLNKDGTRIVFALSTERVFNVEIERLMGFYSNTDVKEIRRYSKEADTFGISATDMIFIELDGVHTIHKKTLECWHYARSLAIRTVKDQLKITQAQYHQDYQGKYFIDDDVDLV